MQRNWQWIQRRGRLLRTCREIGKTHSEIHDFIALPPNIDNIDYEARTLIRSELLRIQEFASLARNAGRRLTDHLSLIDKLVNAVFMHKGENSMPLNERKIISIILDECKNIEERYDGYKEEMIEVISDILQYEREHRISRTDIQKKINDKCNAAGYSLSEKRSRTKMAEGNVQ